MKVEIWRKKENKYLIDLYKRVLKGFSPDFTSHIQVALHCKYKKYTIEGLPILLKNYYENEVGCSESGIFKKILLADKINFSLITGNFLLITLQTNNVIYKYS